MNPVLQHSTPNNINDLLQDVKSGKVDAKKQVLSMLDSMTPQQKQYFRNMLPMIAKVAGQYNIASDEAMNEISAHL